MCLKDRGMNIKTLLRFLRTVLESTGYAVSRATPSHVSFFCRTSREHFNTVCGIAHSLGHKLPVQACAHQKCHIREHLGWEAGLLTSQECAGIHGGETCGLLPSSSFPVSVGFCSWYKRLTATARSGMDFSSAHFPSLMAQLCSRHSVRCSRTEIILSSFSFGVELLRSAAAGTVQRVRK